jgi:hypothetical protein
MCGMTAENLTTVKELTELVKAIIAIIKENNTSLIASNFVMNKSIEQLLEQLT